MARGAGRRCGLLRRGRLPRRHCATRTSESCGSLLGSGGVNVITDQNGRYQFRSIVPSGYGCPPGGSTQRLLDMLGRHGRRPAHIHFFITAPGNRKLTTQINIDGDAYLWDDFAFASREGLVPAITRITDASEIAKHGVDSKKFSDAYRSFASKGMGP